MPDALETVAFTNCCTSLFIFISTASFFFHLLSTQASTYQSATLSCDLVCLPTLSHLYCPVLTPLLDLPQLCWWAFGCACFSATSIPVLSIYKRRDWSVFLFITFSIKVICKGALVSSVSLLNIFLNIFLEVHTLYFLLYLIYILSPKSPIFHSQLCLFVCFFCFK